MPEERDRIDIDRIMLGTAARAALKGRGFVEPNPMVGAVVVSAEGRAVAKGWHADYGGPHAERAALDKAGGTALGGTLYVTLEPCSTTGKTPPCTERIIAAGVRRVVAGAVDPNPRHKGRGFEILRKAGVDAELLPDAGCESLLAPFRRSLKLDRPYVVLKWAMTLDGRIAARDGSSRWISGALSRRTVHRLRGHADGVMVGSRTVLVDDPRLDCRLGRAPLRPARIVVDPRLETPPDARMFGLPREGNDAAGPVWIFTAPGRSPESALALDRAGAEVISLEKGAAEGRAFLEETLSLLFEKGIRRLLVEGGSRVFTSFVEARLADQAVVFVSPKLVGGGNALSPVEGAGVPSMDEALLLNDPQVVRSGEDAMIVGFF